MSWGILFDLDGTLLDSLGDLTDAVNYTLAHYGCPARTPEEIATFLGNGALHLIKMSLPGKETDPEAEEALAFYQPYYRAHSNIKTGPYDGILPALKELSKKYPLAIVTNKPHGAAVPLCKAQFGDVYTLGEEPGYPRKPAADMLFKAMTAIGVDKCVYVGDTEVDILTAKNATMPCLSVTWGFRTKTQLLDAGANYLCDDPADMPKMIEEILNGK